MTLFTYLDTKYRNLNIELQREYTIPKEAELKAAYSLIQMQRTLFKWSIMPLLFLKYILINLGVLKAPELLIKMKVEQAPEKEVPAAEHPSNMSTEPH